MCGCTLLAAFSAGFQKLYWNSLSVNKRETHIRDSDSREKEPPVAFLGFHRLAGERPWLLERETGERGTKDLQVWLRVFNVSVDI